jgi:Fur family peroxide stress response transcriptional regulator
MFTADELCEKLRQSTDKKKKVTPQRRLIYKALEGKTNHPTADEIWEEVKSIMPDVSLATVYKTLRELVETGDLVEIRHNNDSSRFDPRTDEHSHLLCMACNKLEDVSQIFPQLTLSSENKHGFRVVKNEVIFYGYCPHCQ